MAIGSAAIPFNIDFVLDHLDIRKYFSAIVSADDVKISKPDPETFLRAADLLNVKPSDCLVFEDAPKGVEAARRAGMNCVVLTTMHNRNEFSDTGEHCCIHKRLYRFFYPFTILKRPFQENLSQIRKKKAVPICKTFSFK